MKVAPITEAQVAAGVAAFLIREGWECWPEVELPEGRADIVGVRPFPFLPHRRCVHIVETKTTWSLTLLEQAVSRKHYAHYVSIAAPTKVNNYFRRLCRQEGIGLIRVYARADGEGGWECSVDDYRVEHEAPRLLRHKHGDRYFGPHRTLAALHDDQKRFAPGGTAASGYSTPWRRTMDEAAKKVAENPGITAKELARVVQHHYSNTGGARQGFLTWLEKRDDVEARREGSQIRFYPKGHLPTPALAV
jgi:hypothetical protein